MKLKKRYMFFGNFIVSCILYGAALFGAYMAGAEITSWAFYVGAAFCACIAGASVIISNKEIQ